jgi:hypothetical protein
MVELPRRVDLRLTIPAAGPWRDLAVDLAVKFAEYAGSSSSAADVSRAVVAAIGPADGRPAIALLLSAVDGTLTVTLDPSTD